MPPSPARIARRKRSFQGCDGVVNRHPVYAMGSLAALWVLERALGLL